MDLPQGPDTVADLEFTENSEESSGKKKQAMTLILQQHKMKVK